MLRHVRIPLVLPTLASLAVVPAVRAQAVRVVRGSVADLASGTPLPSAIVRPLDAPGTTAASTSPWGTFVLRVPAGAVRLVATRIGFAPETLTVAADSAAVVFRLSAAPVAIDPVAVAADRSFSAASSDVIRQLDIQIRPRESAQELLRLAPGLVIAQHAGGGKAEQIFLRGFDADHGTDVAVTVDGAPVNLVSHAHGQGYADLHFLIPEIVDHADVRKGPYAPRDGDFATAGAVDFSTRDRLDFTRAAVTTRAGSFGTAHTLALVPFGGDARRAGGYLAGAGHFTEGPFERPQDYRRLNLFGKWTAPLGQTAQVVATASGFGARWNGSGQIPERAVASGMITRFGLLDPSEGGNTEREELALGVRSAAGDDDRWEARAYVVRYRLQLYSDFTFFLKDSINGDGIEQDDARSVAGFRAQYGRLGSLAGRAARWTGGIGGRADWGDVALYHQRQRQRLDTRVDDRVRQGQLYAWGRQELELGDRLRIELGLRGDVFRFDLLDRLVGQPAAIPHASGIRWRGIVSPKANLAVQLSSATTAFADFGSGFHSNDARDVILAASGDRMLPRAVGAEAGLRHSWAGGSAAVALWGLDLQSELVYSGDEGTTEASGRTRRAGFDFEGRMQLALWLWADADLNLARGRFRDAPAGHNRIPLAPTITSTGGLSGRGLGPVTGGLRYRFVGSRAAIEDNSVVARGYLIWESFGSWRISRFEVVFTVDNLFNARWNEAQFATRSRLRGEPAPITELHFTPGAPRGMQLGVEYRF